MAGIRRVGWPDIKAYQMLRPDVSQDKKVAHKVLSLHLVNDLGLIMRRRCEPDG
jgi:hypothetical protein